MYHQQIFDIMSLLHLGNHLYIYIYIYIYKSFMYIRTITAPKQILVEQSEDLCPYQTTRFC